MGLSAVFANVRSFLSNRTGAVSRTILSKHNDTISVRDFGAVGDGVTDDTAAFQAAYDSLSVVSADAKEAGEILIPDGEYLLSSPMTATANKYVSWRFGGRARIINYGNLIHGKALQPFWLSTSGGYVGSRNVIIQGVQPFAPVRYVATLSVDPSAGPTFKNYAFAHAIDVVWNYDNSAVIVGGVTDPADAPLSFGARVLAERGANNTGEKWGQLVEANDLSSVAGGGTNNSVTSQFVKATRAHGTALFGHVIAALDESGGHSEGAIVGLEVGVAAARDVVNGSSRAVGVDLIPGGYVGETPSDDITGLRIRVSESQANKIPAPIQKAILIADNAARSEPVVTAIETDTRTGERAVYLRGNWSVVAAEIDNEAGGAAGLRLHGGLGGFVELGDKNATTGRQNARLRSDSGQVRLAVMSDDFGTEGIDLLRLENKASAPSVISGSGSPEGVETANPGSLYMRDDGGTGTSLYVKESGTGNTGWIAK